MKSFILILLASIAMTVACRADDPPPDPVLLYGNGDKHREQRMPARPVIGQYGEGVFSVPEWPWLDETAHLTIVTTDGAEAADLDCSGTDIAAGIYVGRFDSFAVTITTPSGITLTGSF